MQETEKRPHTVVIGRGLGRGARPRVILRTGCTLARRPRARTDLRSQEMGTELLLYDPKSDQVHILNETAMQVWEMCDGQHEEPEIAAELGRRYADIDAAVLEQDTARLIEDFLKKGLIALEG